MKKIMFVNSWLSMLLNYFPNKYNKYISKYLSIHEPFSRNLLDEN